MYRSPIEIIVSDMYTEMVRKQEEAVNQAVLKYDVVVDKEELIKALQYDRHQYEKGLADATNSLVRCKDCVGKSAWYENDYGCTICGLSGLYVVEDNDFCSYGERIDG